MTAAAFLAKEGKKVLLIEKNDECGGLVSSFSRNGFQFDAGVRALLNAGIIFPMLKELDIQLEVVNSPVSVGIADKIVHIEDAGSLREYEKLLVKFYPDSEAEIGRLMRIIRNIMKHMDVLYGVDNPVIKDVWKDKKFISLKLLPWLPKFMATLYTINRMYRPVEEYLKDIVDDASLRDIITQHFFKSTPSFFALGYFSLYLQYFYPKGGTGKLAEAVENKIKELGVEIQYETVIERVHAGERKVVDQNNVPYSYERLIWAADLKTLYRITETEGLSRKIQAGFEEKKEIMLKRRGGDSVYSLYLEVDEPVDSFKRIANGHFFYTPEKTGLGDTHWGELDHLLDRFDDVSKEEVLDWLDKYIRLNTFEISIPGMKDPSMVPEGKTGLIISFLTEYDLFQKIRQAGWYKEFITELENRIIQVISDSAFPMLKDKIQNHYSFTPLSIANRVSSSEGAITGWSFRDPIPVINQMFKSGRSVKTPIPSILQAGQWSYSPAGVPMSILTGKLAADKA